MKKLKKKHILSAEFSDDELERIDEEFANFHGKKSLVVKALLKGEFTTPQDGEQFKELLTNRQRKAGSKRSIEIPEGYFDDFEGRVSVITTGEQRNKQAVLQSLSSIFETVSKTYNPQTGTFAALEDPTLARIFATIVDVSGAGISPFSIMGKVGKGPTAPVQTAMPVPPVPSPISTPTPTV